VLHFIHATKIFNAKLLIPTPASRQATNYKS